MKQLIKPSARYRHSMVYDSDFHKVILFGGTEGSNNHETWIYDLLSNTWTKIDALSKPTSRKGHSMVYDSNSHKVILILW